MSKQARSKIAQAVDKMMKGDFAYTSNTHSFEDITFNLYDLFKHKLTKEARDAVECVQVYNAGIHQRNEDISGIYDFLKFLDKTGNQGVDEKLRLRYNGDYRIVLDRVIYLGKLATVEKLEVAVDRVCNGLNKLAKRGYITGALAPLMGIRLARTSARQKPKVIIISYVAIVQAGEEYLKKSLKGLVIKEGEVPNKV